MSPPTLQGTTDNPPPTPPKNPIPLVPFPVPRPSYPVSDSDEAPPVPDKPQSPRPSNLPELASPVVSSPVSGDKSTSSSRPRSNSSKDKLGLVSKFRSLSSSSDDKERERVRDKIKGFFGGDSRKVSGGSESPNATPKSNDSDGGQGMVTEDPTSMTPQPKPDPPQPHKSPRRTTAPLPPADFRPRKAPSSGSQLSSDQPTLTPSGSKILTPATSREPLQVGIHAHFEELPRTQSFGDVKQAQPPTLAKIPERRADPMLVFHSADFRQSVANAQKSVDKLSTTMTVLKGLTAGLELGAGWLPGVGKGVELIVQMLDNAKQLSLGKVAALRLVERSATVLNAVQQAVIDNKGRLSDVNQKNVDQLITNIEESAKLMVQLSRMPWLKLYLHMDENQRQLAMATENLADFIDMFQLQISVSTAAWQEQSRLDHERDLQLLLQKQEEARQDDQALLRLLELKADQQQEAIKTLQRTLDRLVAAQSVAPSTAHDQEEDHFVHPGALQLGTGSPASFAQPRIHSEPEPSAKIFSAAITTPETARIATANFSYSQVPGPRPSFIRDRTISPEGTQHHQEFCEHALDVLRRHSASSDLGVPEWTITPLEITQDVRVKRGGFSEIWRGRWQGEDVAIKELNASADRQLFIHEVDVWRQLKSKWILPFLGASSTTGPPPWFLVSPYMRNGDVLKYLKSDQGKFANKLAVLHQIAEGMEYLHGREIIHGDLKASNILIDDDFHAILCDFGLSKLKMDIVTKSKPDSPVIKAMGGTMRWQSPERLNGQALSFKDDVYAFGITVCEMSGTLFTDQVPYGYVDDFLLKKSILRGQRPAKPPGMPDELYKICQKCWAANPVDRPSFVVLVKMLSKLYTPSTARTQSAQTGTTDGSSSYTTASEGGAFEEQRAISPEHHVMTLPEEDSSSSGSVHSIPSYLEREPSFDSDRAERHYRHYLQHEFDDRLTLPLWFPSVVSLGEVGYIRHGQFVKLLDAQHPPAARGNRTLPPMPYLDEFSTLHTNGGPVNVRTAAERGLDLVTSLTSFIRSSGEQTKQAISRRIAFPLKPGMKQAALIVDDGVFEIYDSFAEARRYLVSNINWILNEFGEAHHVQKEDIIIVVGALKAANFAMLVSNFAPRTTVTFNVHAKPEVGKPWGTWAVNRRTFDAAKAFKPGNGSKNPSAKSPMAKTKSPSLKSTSAKSSPSLGPKQASKGSKDPTPLFLDEYEPGGRGNYGVQSDLALNDSELRYSARVSTGTPGMKEAVMLAKLRFPPGSNEPTLYP